MNICKKKLVEKKRRSKRGSMHICDLHGCCSIRDGLTHLTAVKYAKIGTTPPEIIERVE